MRSLFHSPFPCTQPPSQQPSPTATVSLQSEMCHRPHPAPMRRQRRSPALLSAARPLPRSRAYLDPAHGPLSPAPRAPAMPRPHPCLAPPPAPIAPHHLSTAPLPPAPIGLASSASHPPHAVARIASTPLRAAIRIPLCRHRADSALIAPHHDHRAPPPSDTCCATPSASRPPCADIRVTPPHLSPRVAAAPGPWLARTAPYASPFRRMREKGPLSGNIRSKCMLFEIKMATSSPHASISGRNRAIQDTWRANLAAKGPLSRRGTRNHAWREDVASAARPFRGSGLRSGRMGFAPCGAGLACLPHAPPYHLACARRGLQPATLGMAERALRPALALRHPRPATRSLYRRISLPARRTHPASRADPPRPGNKRNNTDNSMRA